MAASLTRSTPAPPRQRLLLEGAATLSDTELLAVLIGSSAGSEAALEIASRLLHRFGGLRGILAADYRTLSGQQGVGLSRAATLLAVRECTHRYLAEKLTRGTPITSPRDSQAYLEARLRDQPQEVFCCLYLDTRHRVLKFEELFRGTLDAAAIYPRELVRRALQCNAAAVIVAHNHPSGEPEPSEADRLITRRIRDALELLEMRLLDHLIIGSNHCVSLAARGLL